jgi:16S rRNA (cytosine967-C5)-methyltransferase
MDRIPARAAIDESVELAKQAGHRFASAMVNAVLRKLAKGQKVAEEIEINPALYQGTTSVVPILQQNEAGALAPEGNFPADLEAHPDCEAHPEWLVARWTRFYGPETARAICRRGQSQPAVTVRLSNPAVEAELIQAGISLEAGQLLTAARTVLFGDVTATAAFREGRVRLQDEGSQLVAELAGFSSESMRNPSQNEMKILDACAAPGGKTLILAERNPMVRIIALESSAPRLEQLRKRLAPLGERVECRLGDATALAEEAAFDLVLADVPCSGTGTLGRNPEIRHRLRPEELTRQAERQRAILAAALRAARPGGRVVYSTCSLEPEENEQVVAAVLAATPNTRMVSLEGRIGELLAEGILTANGAKRLCSSLRPVGALRLLPGAFHTDGFFIALIERMA